MYLFVSELFRNKSHGIRSSFFHTEWTKGDTVYPIDVYSIPIEAGSDSIQAKVGNLSLLMEWGLLYLLRTQEVTVFLLTQEVITLIWTEE